MRRIVMIVLSMVVISVLLLVVGLQYRTAQLNKVENYTWQITEQIVSEMDDETLQKQLFMLYFQLDDITAWQNLMPGGIFIHTGNMSTLSNGNTNLPLLNSGIEKINNIYRKKNIPRPYYAIDQEGGRIHRIKNSTIDFPSAMTIGEAFTHTHREDLPLLAGFYTCMELRMHGIQWPLTPVVDVQTNPDNPVIGIRSFGSDPKLVTTMASQYIKGVQNARCMSSIKHFPGHGDTNLDSHKNLPTISKTKEELDKVDLYPFKNLIASKNPPQAVMSAHIIFNKISPIPATLSYAWLTEKLRKEWNYQGIIITDNLAMKAMSIYKKNEDIENVAVNAFLAGADVLLFAGEPKNTKEIIQGFMTACRKKIIPKERITQSVKKIIYQKINMGLLDVFIRENMKNWSPGLQRQAELLLRRSNEIEVNIKSIESQLATVDSVNNFMSRNGIKTLVGNPDSEKNIHSYPVFTDITENESTYQEIQKKSVQVYSLSAISEKLCGEKCVILHTQNTPLEELLAKKGTKPWIIYSIYDPFPANKFMKFFKENDILISTFSTTDTSRDKLIETWISNTIPPRASVMYQHN